MAGRTLYTFYTKAGELTGYALRCGYVQNCDRHNIYTKLYCRDLTYFVRTRDLNNWTYLEEGFQSLKDARRAYRRHCKLTSIPKQEHQHA